MINKNGWRTLPGYTLLFIVLMANCQGINKAQLSSSSGGNESQEQVILDTSKDQANTAASGNTSSISSSSEKRERSLIIFNTGSAGYLHEPVDPRAASENINLASRDGREVEDVLNRNRGAIYSLYARALHDNKKLYGKVVLQLTILSSGEVGSCKVLSNSMNDAEFERKLVARVSLINFGSGDFRTLTVVYPLELLPEKSQEK